VKVSTASRCVVRGLAGARIAVLVALCGQLAMLAHGALVEHVTCGADGALVHVRAPDGVARPVAAGDVARVALAGGRDEDDHCLLDEDGEAACPSAPVASAEPVPARRAVFAHDRRTPCAARRAPLYRLAPKNSPPA
jgi:hypothetical protein